MPIIIRTVLSSVVRLWKLLWTKIYLFPVCRVAQGSYLPRAPTDPDVRISRIRFFVIMGSLKPVLLSVVVSFRPFAALCLLCLSLQQLHDAATVSLGWVLLAPVPHLHRYNQ